MTPPKGDQRTVPIVPLEPRMAIHRIEQFFTSSKGFMTPMTLSEDQIFLETILKWILQEPMVRMDFYELLGMRRSNQSFTSTLKAKRIIQIFIRLVQRDESPPDHLWIVNFFTAFKMFGALIITLFWSDIIVLNTITKIFHILRDRIETASKDSNRGLPSTGSHAAQPGNHLESLCQTCDLGGQDHLRFVLSLCGLEEVSHHDTSNTRAETMALRIGSKDIRVQISTTKVDPDRISASDVLDSLLRSRLSEALTDYYDPTCHPWKSEAYNPAIETLEQQSRIVLVYGEFFEGVLDIVRSIIKRRRQTSRKIMIAVVQDDSRSRYELNQFVDQCMGLFGRNSRKVSAMLVVIPFSGISNLMAIVDRVVVGVKGAFSNGTALAHKGTAALCMVAKHMSKNVICVSPSLCLAPFGEDEYRQKHVEHDELVPPSLISFYILPSGMFPPSALEHEIARHIHSNDDDLVGMFLRASQRSSDMCFDLLTCIGLAPGCEPLPSDAPSSHIASEEDDEGCAALLAYSPRGRRRG